MRHHSTDPEYTQISDSDKVIRDQIVKMIQQHTREMGGYSYFGSNPGVSVDDYEELADEIMIEFNIQK